MNAPRIRKDFVKSLTHGDNTKSSSTVYDVVEELLVSSSPKDFAGLELWDLVPHGWGMPIAILYMTGTIVAFVVLLYINITTNLSRQFLSLDPSGGGSVCNVVPQQITGTFYADFYGIWNTNGTLFRQNASIFAVDFIGSSIGNNEYEQAMLGFRSKLATLGVKSAQRSAAWNSLVYSVYSYSDNSANMRFYSSADAGIIFDQQVWAFALSTQNGVCNPYDATSKWVSGRFDKASKRVVIDIPLVIDKRMGQDQLNQTAFDHYFQDSCPKQGPGGATPSIVAPFVTGPPFVTNILNSGSLGGPVASFGFDIRSASLAIALNFNLVDPNHLVRIDTKTSSDLGFVAYLDPSYDPPMDPIYCMDKHSSAFTAFTAEQISGPEVCFVAPVVSAGELNIYYPVLQQFKTSFTDGLYAEKVTWLGKQSMCTCPEDARTPYCQTNDFFVGFVFDNMHRNNTPRIGLEMQKYMINNPTDGDVLISKHWQDVIAYTADINYDLNLADVPITAYTNADTGVTYNNTWAKRKSFNQLLNGAFKTACPWSECGMFLYETSGIEGATSVALAINKFYVRLSQFTTGEHVSFQPGPGLPAVNFTLQSCVDTISQQDALLKLSATPPVSLVQNYYQCTPTLAGAFTTSIGNASASTALYINLGMLALGFFGYYLINWVVESQGFKLVPRIKKERLNYLHEKKRVQTERSLLVELVQANRLLLETHSRLTSDDNSTAKVIHKLQVKLEHYRKVHSYVHMSREERKERGVLTEHDKLFAEEEAEDDAMDDTLEDDEEFDPLPPAAAERSRAAASQAADRMRGLMPRLQQQQEEAASASAGRYRTVGEEKRKTPARRRGNSFDEGWESCGDSDTDGSEQAAARSPPPICFDSTSPSRAVTTGNAVFSLGNIMTVGGLIPTSTTTSVAEAEGDKNRQERQRTAVPPANITSINESSDLASILKKRETANTRQRFF